MVVKKLIWNDQCQQLQMKGTTTIARMPFGRTTFGQKMPKHCFVEQHFVKCPLVERRLVDWRSPNDIPSTNLT
jgi:hypothetical protein